MKFVVGCVGRQVLMVRLEVVGHFSSFSKLIPKYLALKFHPRFIDCSLNETGRAQCLKAMEFEGSRSRPGDGLTHEKDTGDLRSFLQLVSVQADGRFGAGCAVNVQLSLRH